mgnify:CR=1 FL=1
MISKTMTSFLLHDLHNWRWEPDAQGYVIFRDLKFLLNIKGYERVPITTDEILYVVMSGNRFEIL